tara:strand:+ start:419 stop:1015 length:597 start_codon:yes stop_codon:yes gene_type:complete
MALRKSQKSLRKWTKQKWRTASGKKSSETGEVYAPEEQIKRLKSTAKGRRKLARANQVKRKATKEGKQHAKHGLHKRKRKVEGGLESTPYDAYYKLFASPFSIAYNNKEDTRLKTAADMGLAGTIKRNLSQIQEINGQYYIAPTIDFNTGEQIEGQAVINQLNSFIDEGVVRGYDSKRTANKQARLLIENLIQEQRKQ